MREIRKIYALELLHNIECFLGILAIPGVLLMYAVLFC